MSPHDDVGDVAQIRRAGSQAGRPASPSVSIPMDGVDEARLKTLVRAGVKQRHGAPRPPPAEAGASCPRWSGSSSMKRGVGTTGDEPRPRRPVAGDLGVAGAQASPRPVDHSTSTRSLSRDPTPAVERHAVDDRASLRHRAPCRLPLGGLESAGGAKSSRTFVRRVARLQHQGNNVACCRKEEGQNVRCSRRARPQFDGEVRRRAPGGSS